MPPNPSAVTYETSFYGSAGTTLCGTSAAANYVTFNFVNTTSATSGCTGSNMLTNWSSFNSFSTQGTFGQTWGSTGPGRREWEPVQATALRKDFQALKTSWKRKRAEIKAKRFFHRVVGDVAFQKFKDKGYHEIIGFSRTRYRLRPGFRVQVMLVDEVDYELCAHLEIGIPWHDSMAVQHLMLTASQETEDKFRAAANRHDAHSSYPIQELTDAA